MATTPLLLPGESRGQRSLGGHSPRGRTESDVTEHLRTVQIRANAGNQAEESHVREDGEPAETRHLASSQITGVNRESC